MWNDFSDFYDFFYIEVVNKPKIKGEVAKHRFFQPQQQTLLGIEKSY